jgi:hypothetical protein
VNGHIFYANVRPLLLSPFYFGSFGLVWISDASHLHFSSGFNTASTERRRKDWVMYNIIKNVFVSLKKGEARNRASSVLAYCATDWFAVQIGRMCEKEPFCFTFT